MTAGDGISSSLCVTTTLNSHRLSRLHWTPLDWRWGLFPDEGEGGEGREIFAQPIVASTRLCAPGDVHSIAWPTGVSWTHGAGLSYFRESPHEGPESTPWPSWRVRITHPGDGRPWTQMYSLRLSEMLPLVIRSLSLVPQGIPHCLLCLLRG